MLGHDITWSVTTVKVSDLIPFDKNPRKHTKEDLERLKRSIVEIGFHTPIHATMKNEIIGGHMRIKALKELGIKEVLASRPNVELNEEQFTRVLFEANTHHGEFDIEIIEQEFHGVDLIELGMDDDVVSAVRKAESKAGLIDDDESPEPPAVSVSASGDVWLLGAHRVMCGSATVNDDVARLMDGKKADMLLTDPPYNVAYEGKTKDALTIKNDSMGDIAFRQFLTDAFETANSALRAGGVFYIWHADSEGYNFRGACQDVGWKVRQCLIWLKNTIVMGRQDYHWKHEPCLYGWKEGAAHTWESDRKQSTIIECNKPTRNGVHPTMKPIELMEYQIGNNTKIANIVLDLFGGSGSTLIACEKTGRACRMMELDPKYVDVIVKRWQAFTGEQARLESTGQTFEEAEKARA